MAGLSLFFSMSIPIRHVYIADATWQGDGAQVQAMDQAIHSKAPHTQALLASWQAVQAPPATPDDWATPLERAWASALGWQASGTDELLDQPLPLAALELGGELPPNTPAAWLHPVHMAAGMNDVRLSHPNELDLSAQHSQDLLAALKPLCTEDGVELRFVSPDRWLLVGERLRGIVSPSLHKAAKDSVDGWLPFSATHTQAAKWMRRLQNEAQMLFYTHPVQDQRKALGLPPVSGVWLQGAGALAQPLTRQGHVELLRDLALHVHKPFDWQAAWAALDASCIKELLSLGNSQAIYVSFASHNGISTYASPALATTLPQAKTGGWLLSMVRSLTMRPAKQAHTIPSALAPH